MFDTELLTKTIRVVTSREARSHRSELKRLLLVMKLVAAIMLICSLHVTAKSVSQTITLSGKDLPLQNVLTEIEKQSGYLVIYDKDVIITAAPVTVEAKEEPLLEFLDNVLHDKGLDYFIENKTIAVRKKEESILKVIMEKMTPPIDVKGRVVDEKGEPVEGVTVAVKGTNKATSTNANGEFELKGVKEDATVIVTGVNVENRELKINGQNYITLATLRRTTNLNEVVINKGYYSEKQRNSVGNSVHVTKEEIERQPVQNPLLALQGRVPGMEITQLTGLNGGGVKVRIQGRNSLSAGLNPLIVVDGVPFPSQLMEFSAEILVQGGSPLNYINPNDIESVDVLKDADATAIYGSRAANGAILITTKKGKAGKTRLSVSMQHGWSKVTRFAKMLNTRQYLDVRYEAFKNDGIDLTTVTPDATNYDLTLWDTTRYTNWQKELIGGKAQYTNINASISGGNGNLSYLIGTTYSRRTTVFPGNFDDKSGALHFSINSASANQRFTVQLIGNLMYDNNHLPGVDFTGTAVLLEPTAPALYNENGTLNWAPDVSGRSTWKNPLAYAENSDFKNEAKNLVTQIDLGYKILPNLSLSSRFGVTNTISDSYLPTRLEYYSPERRTTSQRSAVFGKRNMSNWLIEPQLSYSANVGRGKFDGLLGGSFQRQGGDILEVSGVGFANDQLMGGVASAPIKNVDISNSFQYKYVAVFGRLNYNWDEKYVFNITARRDGSSRFGDKNKFHNFWSAGAGWIFSEGKWAGNLGILSFGKLRASYGTTGNDQIGDYQYVSTYQIANPGIAYQGASGLYTQSIPNPYQQWEETKKWQGGIDLGFVKDRIVIGVTYARNQSSNQLISYVLPDVTGFSYISKNFPATIRNTSWEFTLHTINLNANKLNWTSDFNLTIPRNKLVKFPGIENTSYASGFGGVIVGQPLDIQKVYRYGGLDPLNGKYTIVGYNGNVIQEPDFPQFGVDEIALVNPHFNKFYGGWNNTVSFKSWRLDIFFQFVKHIAKNDFYYGNPVIYPGSFIASLTSNQPVSILNHWIKPGDMATIQPYSTHPFAPRYPVLSDIAYNYDASYVRLKNVSLSWQLPVNVVSNLKFHQASVYFRGENIVTFTKFVGMDPESQSVNSLPPLQTWTIGVKLDF